MRLETRLALQMVEQWGGRLAMWLGTRWALQMVEQWGGRLARLMERSLGI
jgi:hypothetical protein